MYQNYAKIRDAKGLKDSDVCKGAGIPQGTMSDWKRGRYNLKADKLAKIAEFLGVSVDALLGVPNSGQGSEYYINEETAKEAQRLFDDPDYRVLFDAARDSRPEDLRMAADLLQRLKRTNPDG